MREINREIGLDDALRTMGVSSGNDRSDSSGDEKSRSTKREIEEIEMKT